LASAVDLMAYYSQRFGPYPYKSFSIAPVHLGYGGEQMSNLVFIDTRVFELPKLLDRYFDFLIAHETGHQWFYNIVGANNFTHIWLEEGINSYFLLNYLEDKYGKNAAILDLDRLPSWVKAFVPELTFKRATDVRYKMAVRAGLDQPILSKLSSFHEPSNIFALTYGKGSRVVAMLNTTIGQEGFDRIFSRIFKEYAFKNLDIEDFMRIAQEESRVDLKEFFQQWLFTAKNLDVRVAKVKGNTVSLQRRGGIMMPVEAAVTYKDGTRENMVWDGKKTFDRLVTDKKVRQVILDPEGKLLDIDRTNNTWPRRVNVRPVPLYHPLYDIAALMPDEQYNLIIGPEISNGIGVKTSFQKPYDYSITAATDYDFSEQIQRSRAGIEIKNVLHSQTAFGIEGAITNDYDTGEDDLVSQKIYVRKELWPFPYGLTQVNDHVSVYALRNRTPSAGWGSERIRNTSYLKHDESIAGAMLHFDRSQPWPDPRAGYTIDTLIENSGHWAGATQTFTRASIDGQVYRPVTAQSKMACRIKYGWGSSDDKNLFELGGADGLRGFDRKTVRGSDALMGSVEYRFPLMDELKLSVADHWLTLKKVSAVGFFDAGQAWRDNFEEGKFRKDAGAGLRLHLTVGSMLEDLVLRLDVAKAIGEKQDARAWFGLNHAF
ncbi:MAG: BamA/TamA family outer membrane protein, partial [Candidatus Omnitrophica bacterium]|nr:BamA/TamA family outer membrane protein [Candidatus Omnitrophota bacterium]